MTSPKYATFVFFIGTMASCAATNEPATNPFPLLDEQIHITSITPTTYSRFLERFTEDCRPLANKVVVAVALSAGLFNDAEYQNADYVYSRQVNEQILTFFNSKDCATEDLVIMLEETELLAPLKYNILCMLRIKDAEDDFAQSGKYMDESMETIDMRASYAHMGLAVGALEEVIKNKMCQYTSQNLQDSIAEVLEMYRELQAGLLDIVEMPAYKP